MRRRIGQRLDELELLDYRAGPAVRDDDRQSILMLRAHMQDMQSRCDQVQTQLEQANSGTRHLLERADVLVSQK